MNLKLKLYTYLIVNYNYKIIMNELINFTLTYNDKLTKLSLPADSELFQLKMMACGKLKIYDVSKCIMIYKEDFLDRLEGKEILSNVFISNEDNKIKIITESNENINMPKLLNEKILDNLNVYEMLNQHQKEFRPSMCLCMKNEVNNACLKCGIFICDACKQRETHIIHMQEIIKLSNFKNYLNGYMENTSKKIENEILLDESYLFLQNFKDFFTQDVDKINKQYEYLKSVLEEIKENQINYLIQIQEKLSYKERYDDITNNIENLTQEMKNFTMDKDYDLLLNFRKKMGREVEFIMSKYNLVSKYLTIYIAGTKDMTNINKLITSVIKEKSLATQTSFNETGLNSKLSSVTKTDYIKQSTGKNYKKDQVIMRLRDPHTIVYFKLKKNNSKVTSGIKTRSFLDNCNFKSHYQENDEIELNIDNKLFILTGRKYNQFFFYDYEKNEMIQLPELKNCHFYGNLIYVPLNNCIYCLGGINSKKCEIYRNDEILFSNISEDIRFNKNCWENVAEMNVPRQECSSMLFTNYLYVFFGFNNNLNSNNSSIERINVLKNDTWELINYSNPMNLNLHMSSLSTIEYNENEILFLGGFDGKSYLESIISFNTNTMTITKTNMKIPDLKKNSFYHFFKESSFCHIFEYENIMDENSYNFALFDSKERLHLINTRVFKYSVIQIQDKV